MPLTASFAASWICSRADGSVFRADRDGDAADFPEASVNSPAAWIQSPAIRLEPIEDEALVSLACSGRRLCAGCRGSSSRSGPRRLLGVLVSDRSVLRPSTRTRCGERLSTVNGPVTRMRLPSS